MTASSLNYLPQWLQDMAPYSQARAGSRGKHRKPSESLQEARRSVQRGVRATRDTEQGLIAYQDLMKAIGQYYEAEEVAGLSLPEDNNDNQGVN